MEVLTAPELQPDPTAEPEVADRIRALNDCIHRNPVEFTTLLRGLAATAGVADLLPLQDGNPMEAAPNPEAVAAVDDYLVNRYERDAQYDDATQAALDSHDAYQARIQDLKSDGGFLAHPPGAKLRLETVASTTAAGKRQSLGIFRLWFFAQRVADYQTQQPTAAAGA